MFEKINPIALKEMAKTYAKSIKTRHDVIPITNRRRGSTDQKMLVIKNRLTGEIIYTEPYN